MFEAAMQIAFGNNFGMFCYWTYHVVTLFILAAGIGWWREFAVRMDFATQTTLKAGVVICPSCGLIALCGSSLISTTPATPNTGLPICFPSTGEPS